MKLYEFEGKDLVKKYDLPVHGSVVIRKKDDLENLDDKKTVVKAQLLTVGSRMKAGAVKVCETAEEARSEAENMLGKRFGAEAASVLIIEDKAEIKNEYYLGITYDTSTRAPVIMFSRAGGVDIEKSEEVKKLHLDATEGVQDWMIIEFLKEAGVKQDQLVKMTGVVKNAYRCFLSEDARLLEINPLAETPEGFVATDVIIELDDDAGFRHKDRKYAERTTRELTEREKAVKTANAADYKGTVKYIEFDGDIGFLAAGGGGSITCMDALVNCGGSPSNYTEYSGNPSSEKVRELTKQILSKPGLSGLWIIGAIANFTRVDTTMQGIVDALKEVKPDFPIVVRRSGPFEKEGLDLLRNAAAEHGLNMTVHGKEMPLTKTAETMVTEAEKYRNRGEGKRQYSLMKEPAY